MVDSQPPVFRADGCGTGTDTLTIPIAAPCTGEEPVGARVGAIGRTGEPDVITTKVDAAGAVEGVKLATNRGFKQDAVFVVGRQNQPVRLEVLPIGGGAQRHGYTIWRYGRERK